MNVKKIIVFWNLLISVFGLNILTHNQEILEINYLKIIWSLIVTALFMILFYFQFTDHISHGRVFSKSNITSFILLGGNIIANSIRFSFLIKTKQFTKLYEKLIEFDDNYFGTKIIIWKSQTFRLLFLCSLILIGYIAFDICFIKNDEEVILGGYIYPIYFSVAFSHMSIFLFWVRNSLDRIKNDYLMGLQSVPVFFGDFTNKKSLKVFQSKSVQLRVVQQARKLYHELFLISRLINDIFAAPVLLMLAHNLALSIIYTYTLTYYIRYQEKMNLFPFHWAILSYAAIFAVIHPFHITSAKASFLVVDIQGLLTTKFDDEHLHRELQEFSVQVQQEKMDFSPFGLFIIKHNIMLGMLGSIATYLVVGTQFNFTL